MSALASGAVDIAIGWVLFGAVGMIIVQLTSEDDGGVHKPRLSRLRPHRRAPRHRARRTARGIGRSVIAYLREDGTTREVRR